MDGLDNIELPSEVYLPSPLGDGSPRNSRKLIEDVPMDWIENEIEYIDPENGSSKSSADFPTKNVLLKDNSYWSPEDCNPHWIVINLRGLCEIDAFQYKCVPGPPSPQECRLEALSTESEEWMTVKQWTGQHNTPEPQTIEFSPRTARQWRLTVINTHGAACCLLHLQFRGRVLLAVPEEQEWDEFGDDEFDFAPQYPASCPPDERLIDTRQLNQMCEAAETYRRSPARHLVTVYENQRWVIGMDWAGENLLPTERPNLSHKDGEGDYFWTEGYGHPVIRCPEGWEWTEEWHLVTDQFGCDKNGWEYAQIFSNKLFTHNCGGIDCVRRRMWGRMAVFRPRSRHGRIASGTIGEAHEEDTLRPPAAVAPRAPVPRTTPKVAPATSKKESHEKPYPGKSAVGAEIWRKRQRDKAESAKAAGGSNESRVARSTEETKGVMADNLRAMHERGERISQIQEASEQMANESRNFRDAAKRMREKAEARNKGFFGGLF